MVVTTQNELKWREEGRDGGEKCGVHVVELVSGFLPLSLYFSPPSLSKARPKKFPKARTSGTGPRRSRRTSASPLGGGDGGPGVAKFLPNGQRLNKEKKKPHVHWG